MSRRPRWTAHDAAPTSPVSASAVAQQWRADFGPWTDHELHERDQHNRWQSALDGRRRAALRRDAHQLRGIAKRLRRSMDTERRQAESHLSALKVMAADAALHAESAASGGRHAAAEWWARRADRLEREAAAAASTADRVDLMAASVAEMLAAAAAASPAHLARAWHDGFLRTEVMRNRAAEHHRHVTAALVGIHHESPPRRPRPTNTRRLVAAPRAPGHRCVAAARVKHLEGHTAPILGTR